jgi:hypothetical protein
MYNWSRLDILSSLPLFSLSARQRGTTVNVKPGETVLNLKEKALRANCDEFQAVLFMKVGPFRGVPLHYLRERESLSR